MNDIEKFELDFRLIEPKLIKKQTAVFKPEKHSQNFLFDELVLSKSISLKNRLFYANLTDNSLVKADGKISDEMFAFYRKIANSGVGMIVMGGAFVGKKSKRNSRKYFCINHSEEELGLFEKFTSEIHSFGTKIFFKINSHFGRGDSRNKLLNLFVRSAGFNSPIDSLKVPTLRISDGTLNALVKQTAKIASFADKTGFDGLVVDASLFGVFGEISSFEMNKRCFGYFNEKIDFMRKFLARISENFKEKIVIFQFSFRSFIEEIYGAEIKKIKTLKSFASIKNQAKIFEFLQKLVELGVDGFKFEFGTFETEFLSTFNELEGERFLYDFYAKINSFFKAKNILNRHGNKVVLIYHDNINSLSSLSSVSEENFVFDISKQILSNLNYLNEFRQNLPYKTCIKCSLCNYACREENRLGCSINPELFDNLKQTEKLNEKIAVVGSGYSGLCAAIYLAERGASIDLFEAENSVNLHGKCREIFGFNEPLKNFNNYLQSRLNFLISNKKINLILNHKYDAAKEPIQKYSSFVIATGFHEVYLNVTGAVLEHVKTIFDVLLDENCFVNKKNIVISAKSELSLSLALYFLVNDKNVSLIIENPEELIKMPNDKLTYFLFELRKHGCKVFVQTKLKRIENDFVELIINNKLIKEKFSTVLLNIKSKAKYRYEAKAKSIDCDMLVYEPDIKPNNKLFYDLVMNKFSGRIFMIGNALQKSDIENDIKTAFFVSKNI